MKALLLFLLFLSTASVPVAVLWPVKKTDSASRIIGHIDALAADINCYPVCQQIESNFDLQEAKLLSTQIQADILHYKTIKVNAPADRPRKSSIESFNIGSHSNE